MQPSVILVTRLLRRGPHLAVHLNSWDESASDLDNTTGIQVCKVIFLAARFGLRSLFPVVLSS